MQDCEVRVWGTQEREKAPERKDEPISRRKISCLRIGVQRVRVTIFSVNWVSPSFESPSNTRLGQGRGCWTGVLSHSKARHLHHRNFQALGGMENNMVHSHKLHQVKLAEKGC